MKVEHQDSRRLTAYKMRNENGNYDEVTRVMKSDRYRAVFSTCGTHDVRTMASTYIISGLQVLINEAEHPIIA